MSEPIAAALVLAGGRGTRVGAESNKVYLPLAGRHLISWSLRAMQAAASIGRVVLVVRADELPLARRIVIEEVDGPVEIVVGGSTRHDSETQGLRALAADVRAGRIDTVAVHDGARPLVTPDLIEAGIQAARTYGAVLPAIDVPDVVHVEGASLRPSHALRLARVQTPQCFAAEPLLSAYEQAARDGFTGTDTAACVERYTALRVRCLPGRPDNIKVTYAADLSLAEHLLLTAR